MDKLTIAFCEMQSNGVKITGDLRPIFKQLADTMRENERLREFAEQVASPPELMPHGLNENDQCIVCGFSHKLMAERAKKALSNKDTTDDR